MAEYQNLFTRVQVEAPHYPGVPHDPKGIWSRGVKASASYWLGKLGDAQIGPFYLGSTGVISIICFIIAFEIVGLNMLASVNWNPLQFIKQLPWLALEPAAPQYGLRLPPLQHGGWHLMAGFFLTVSVLLWWVRTYMLARKLRMGTHTAWAFASAIWLFLVLGFIRPV